MKSSNFVLLGAPGSGKGTQGKRLVRLLGVPQISMGDILRQKRNEASNLGQKLQEIMASGALVPDEVVIDIIRERLQEQDCSNGFILDGFPRTVGQADALDQLLEDISKPLSEVLYLEVPSEILLERLTGRRVCNDCGHEYHVLFKKPKDDRVCDDCGGNLVQRSDDKEETIKNRLGVFEAQTAPLIEYYRRKKLLRRINGNNDMDVVFREIENLVTENTENG